MMTAAEAIERACKEETLVKALTWIAVWETERVIRQAIEWRRTGISTAANGGGWDTAFEFLFTELIARYPVHVVPKGHVLLPQSRQEAEVMHCVAERFLR